MSRLLIMREQHEEHEDTRAAEKRREFVWYRQCQGVAPSSRRVASAALWLVSQQAGSGCGGNGGGGGCLPLKVKARQTLELLRDFCARLLADVWW
ncbi:hypothetical protein E2C01_092809 [Portunus trituberculatus]|uniref:Uncharacterized protein n=1 Tax=Portunus trituberculatus TaxID=210409 RepID=A0A5B7JHE0_PORTR|nr:hypothetical protein [Portunus trituberculatus]